jgi:hypothetical protein
VDRPGLPRLAPRSWLKHPPGTIRLRLTLLYGTLFLGSGAVLLTITYLLLDGATGDSLSLITGSRGGPGGLTIRPLPIQALGSQAVRHALRGQAVLQRAADLHHLLIWSAIALAIMAVISIALGWLVAGRVLGPAAGDDRNHPSDLRAQPPRAADDRRTARRAQRACRHGRRTARQAADRVRRAATIRRQRVARAPHSAHSRTSAARGLAQRSGCHARIGAVNSEAPARDRGAAGATARGAADAGKQPARPRSSRAD